MMLREERKEGGKVSRKFEKEEKTQSNLAGPKLTENLTQKIDFVKEIRVSQE